MRQAVSTKERHKGIRPRSEPFVKGQQGWFARKNRADQHSNKIDQVVVAKASASETHLLLDGFEHTCMREYVRSRDKAQFEAVLAEKSQHGLIYLLPTPSNN